MSEFPILEYFPWPTRTLYMDGYNRESGKSGKWEQRTNYSTQHITAQREKAHCDVTGRSPGDNSELSSRIFIESTSSPFRHPSSPLHPLRHPLLTHYIRYYYPYHLQSQF